MPDSHNTASDARTAADDHVLDGVRKQPEAKAPAKPKSRTTQDVSLPEPDGQEDKTSPDKPVAVRRLAKQDLARRLVEAAQHIFDEEPDGQGYMKGMTQEEAKQQVANWLSPLPTGGDGPGPDRYWPEEFPRPNTTGWVKPS
jgi:DNA-nicking Smr family endonuclease